LSGIKFGESRAKYSYDKNKGIISKGIGSIKYLNESVAEELYELSQNNIYANFVDLLLDIEKTSCNSRQLDILIKLDYFSEFGDPAELTYIALIFDRCRLNKEWKKNIKSSKIGLDYQFVAPYCEEYKPEQVKEINMDAFLENVRNIPLEINPDFEEAIEKSKSYKRTGEFKGWNYDKFFKLTDMPEDIKRKFATKISEAEYRGVDCYKLLTELQYHGEPFSIRERIMAQQEFLSYIDYTNPELDKSYCVVLNLNANYSPKFTAYCLNNGRSCPMKIRKNKKGNNGIIENSYKDTPIHDGDIIQLIRCKKEPKSKFIDGEWKHDYTDKEWWVYAYKVVSSGEN